MSDVQTLSPALPTRRSVLPRLLILGGVMLLVAVALNWRDIRAIAGGQKTVKSVLYGKNLAQMRPAFAFPAPQGPESAKVKVRVVCQEGNGCHQPLVQLWTAVATLERKRLRVEFHHPGEAPEPDAKAVSIGCEAGAAVNGQTKFVLGQGQSKRTLYLTGPTPGPSASTAGPPAQQGAPVGHGGHGGWTMDDVAAIVNGAIQKAYGTKGALTAQAIAAAMPQAAKLIPPARSRGEKGGAVPAGH